MAAADPKEGRPSPADNPEPHAMEFEESKLPSKTISQNQHLPEDIRDDKSLDEWSKIPNWALNGCVDGWIQQFRQCYGARRLPEFAQHRGNIRNGQTRNVVPAFKCGKKFVKAYSWNANSILWIHQVASRHYIVVPLVVDQKPEYWRWHGVDSRYASEAILAYGTEVIKASVEIIDLSKCCIHYRFQ